ncbi:hypothetical protein [Actinosynnema mirum]|uniref:Uncharacterized protein n=1 Tax=Actinosynnema mirum (strain ATCC 29888 / DSM 43827 / JCM 3225 / NBRC 14064 / NCIMB 13271 / NRRL B-12336 / IMRU 3971 / 101) TaxID=446462 RepID=C6WC30_ACTMD|nr:hypothetical protein [Actinosynnema mirum]ACU39418.1 hypothetical protein Amir_5602 [Actinosynnema mirum DSM 43827]
MITAASFPTPHLALRSNDPAQTAAVSEFAEHQAHAANTIPRRYLRLNTVTARTLGDLLDELHAWRWRLAKGHGDPRGGHGVDGDAARFMTTISSAGANYDRLGAIGRMPVNPRWDEASHSYVDGEPTPASRIMEHYGAIARARLQAAGVDELHTEVRLPDGRRVVGNSLVRGERARELAAELIERLRSRGLDTSRFDTGQDSDPVYAITADHADRDTMREAALQTLADAAATGGHADRLAAWRTSRFLLFQAPHMKKGSDAVTRVFLVAVGAWLLDTAPVMQQDADLRCMTLGQVDAHTMPADANLLPQNDTR